MTNIQSDNATGCGSGIKIARFALAMNLIETLWLNAINSVEQNIVRRTYLSSNPPSAFRVIAPLVFIGVLTTVSCAVFRAARYVAFTAVCGAAFYVLLRTL